MTDSRSSRPEAALAMPQFPAGRDTLLLLEDNENIAQLLRLILRNSGLQVVWCQTGAAALTEGARLAGRIALVLADCRLPDCDGREICQQLRQKQPDLPVLITSGNVRLQGMDPLPDTPLVGFLPKPFTPAEVLTQVRSLLQAAA